MYEEILLARVEEVSRRLEAAIENADPAEWVRLLAAAYAGYYLEHTHFFPLFASRKLSRDWGLKTRVGKRLELCMAEVEGQVAEAIEAALEKGALQPHHLLRAKSQDAEACAAEMLGLFFRELDLNQRPLARVSACR
jgi:hypothetical protein